MVAHIVIRDFGSVKFSDTPSLWFTQASNWVKLIYSGVLTPPEIYVLIINCERLAKITSLKFCFGRWHRVKK
jgi:hypothetical protein